MSVPFRRKQRVDHGSRSGDSIMHYRDILKNLYLKCCITDVTGTLMTLYRTLLILVLIVYPCTANDVEHRPGCHLVGYTRPVRIVGCREFPVELNACRGHCLSFAYPSPNATLGSNRRHRITSRAECCSIVDTEDKPYLVDCIGGEQLKIFKSAKSCSCSVCRS